MLNSDPKPSKRPPKERKPLKRSYIRPKRKSTQETAADKEMAVLDNAFFDMLTSKVVDRRCANCGIEIKGKITKTNHHHLLPKSLKKFAHLRHCEDIMVLVDGSCHGTVSNSYGAKSVSKLKELCIEALLRHNFREEAICMQENNSFFTRAVNKF